MKARQNIAPVGIRAVLDENAMVGTRPTGRRRAWTNKEMATLRVSYPIDGVPGCVPLLPGRSASSIYQHANAEGLRAPKGQHGTERQQWTSSPQIDAMITRIYQSTPSKGDIKSLARTLNRPLWWVCKRAVRLGLSTPRFREPPWVEREMEMIQANAHRQPAMVRKLLKRHGFARTETAISVKLKRLGTPTGRYGDLDHYTANALGKLFGLDPKSITRWIEKGWLKATRRGTARVEQQGGDEWWIHRKNIRRFVIENAAAIDIRKVEKFWFVELLTSRDDPRTSAETAPIPAGA